MRQRRHVLFLGVCLLSMAPEPSLAGGGFPKTGGYVPYADIPVQNYDNLIVGNCNSREPWANCQNTLVTRSTAGMGSPVTISSAGTYSSLSAYSSSSGTCAVTITASSGTVTIIEGTFASNGANLICNNGGAAVVLMQNQGFSVPGTATPGKFYSGPNNGINAHDNVWAYLWGFYVIGGTTSGPNVSSNIGYNNYNGAGDISHEIQFNQSSAACATIENNMFVNAPYFSNSNDVINLIQAPAPIGCPATVSGNLILGAYPIDPATQSSSGTCIIIDGSGNDTSANSTQNVNINHNVCLETTNAGIAIAAGFNINATDNIAASDGLFGGGIPSFYGNVGVYSSNQSGSPVFNGSTINVNGNTLYWWSTALNGDNGEYFNGDGSGCNGGYGSPSCTNIFPSPGNTIAQRMTYVASLVHQYFGSY